MSEGGLSRGLLLGRDGNAGMSWGLVSSVILELCYPSSSLPCKHWALSIPLPQVVPIAAPLHGHRKIM